MLKVKGKWCCMVVKNKKYMILFLVIINLFLIFIRLSMKVNNILILNGSNLVLSIEEKYKEPGFNASIFHIDLKDKVKIENNINEAKAGKYYVKYKLNLLFFSFEKTRNVIVKDTIKPTITLEGEETVTICPNKEYEEEGFTAIDNNDGDITNKVEIDKKKDAITYSVEDSNNNRTSITRTIKKEDSEDPKIILKGSKIIYLTQGEEYKEPGYTANDNCDGDLTKKVKVSGSVNKNIIGTYTLTYIVKDNTNHETTVKRTIHVEKKQTGGVIYLTFDDGPSGSITPKVLDILKEENVNATFFVIHHNKSLHKYIKRAYDEGHTIALHSYTHNYKKIYASKEAYFEDLEKIKNEVYEITGEYSNIIRFPGGSSNTVSRFNPKIMTILAEEVQNKGYIYFDWNITSGDAGGAKTKNDVFQNVTRNLTRGSNIVLLHDKENNYITLNALKDIIEYAKIKGYKFDRITSSTKQVHHSINN